jgi:hypothetical protein
MSLLSRIRCHFTGHRLSPWSYLSDGSCAGDQHCTNSGCGMRIAEFERHVLTEWQFLGANSCVQERHCSRCSKPPEEQTAHPWPAWSHAPTETHPCHHVRVCPRCRESAESDIHDFLIVGEPQDVTESYISIVDEIHPHGYTDTTKRCKRCPYEFVERIAW